MSPEDPAVTTARDLTDAFTAVERQSAYLSGYGKRNRLLIWITIVLVVAVAVLAVIAIKASNSANNAHRAAAAEQAARKRQGALVEQKLCLTFARLAALKPPPGNPEMNPAKAYEQALHLRLDQLGTDVGCKSGP